MSFIGVTQKNMEEGLLTGAEMTIDSCITTAQPSMEDSSQKLGIRSTPQPAGSSTDWGALSK